VNFQTAIRSGFNNYANFKGRATRAEYWWWVLFTLIAGGVASAIHSSLGNAASLVTLVPTFAVAVRRMHDTDHRGWWIFVPIANLVFGLRSGDSGENRFGPPPPPSI